VTSMTSIRADEPARALPTASERALVAALRRGDEVAFARLVELHTPSMLRLARRYVRSRSVAEDVVQETWIALLEGLDRFEERATVKTWLFRVLLNIARTRAVREQRVVPMSALGADGDEEGPTVDPTRFLPPDAVDWPRHWASTPYDWRDRPELVTLSRETMQTVRRALDALPERQRTVVELRDVDGLSAEEVCTVLGLSGANQRVLLHRGRARVRQALEDVLDGPR
jgi:RNA polymerase sigma-70 factor, ECF subfamily